MANYSVESSSSGIVNITPRYYLGCHTFAHHAHPFHLTPTHFMLLATNADARPVPHGATVSYEDRGGIPIHLCAMTEISTLGALCPAHGARPTNFPLRVKVEGSIWIYAAC